MNRRQWLRGSATAAVASTFAFPEVVPSEVLGAPGKPGANDRIQLGFIGAGGRTHSLLTEEKFPGAEIVAIADCYLPRCEQRAKDLPNGAKLKLYQHYREMLAKEKLDAVFVETTTHARVLAVAHVLLSGRDVYAEKPMSLTIAEGRYLVKAVEATGRVLQTGSQQRSIPINVFSSRRVREGAIGKIKTVITFNFWQPMGWTPRKAEPVPAGLDWDAWCNQAELRPYNRLLQYGWGNYLDYDTGGQSWGVTGWGTHSLDQVQCALGTDSTGPVEIWPEEEGPNGRVTARYADGTLLRLEGKKRGYEDLGAIFEGEHGTIEICRGYSKASSPDLLKGAPPNTPFGAGETSPHIANFLECVRTRKKPNAHVEIGHRSTTLCHLVNICRIVGRKLQWDPVAECFKGDADANELLERPRRKGYELPSIG
ncbi:Gfo/Idh/MocA family protein [Aquisphaera insulae]|uniref:Gfo/Idh/MocA family protein n=1 Tax=Aquisphaera insulae TaxID=2712864 RepID=UPI0013EABF85|nr:Gfo/Idh/MocA family oxidoreductase [Aquisphaera insulae]